ncbi:MAG: phosphoadenylyl-sulfate reductase [Candidatus Marinimicrobia bacterium]|nr:phosphoadenylyl-sulfate reductase [Candidatus Neomarinimicrobiota bacterium]MBT7378151.1 phosphoadenylyl-sulfate reductase [Candidatus Neomarinimicrobiota bacterium]
MKAVYQTAIEKYEEYGKLLNPADLLVWTIDHFGIDKVVMGTGFGVPGVVLLDILKKVNKNVEVFYIDTGVLFKETYELKNQLESHYDMKFKRFSTQIPIEQQRELYGDELWNRDPNLCCNIRKVMPLKKALSSYDVWITGIRKSQTELRKDSDAIEYDERYNVTKINPLINWTHEQVWDYIEENKLPFNKLHKEGFPSLGCTHCTTSVKSGEDDRAGRWRGSGKTECGLHFNQQNGQIRIVKPGDKN